MFLYSKHKAEIFKKLFDLKDGQNNPYCFDSVIELKMDRASLDRITLKRLQNIFNHAYLNSRHYNKFFSDWNVTPSQLQSLDDIKRFPLLTREHLKNDLDLVTTTSDRHGWVKSSTGGTTSSPISYYRDQHSTWRRLADTASIDAWYGRNLGDRVAYLWGAPQDFANRPSLGMRLRNYTYLKTLMLPSAPLDDIIMESHLQRLDKWHPVFLQAYPTPLYEFCLFLKKRGKKILYLKNASVTAEPIYNHQRALIEEVLGFKVFNWYGSRELGRVATECECHEGLHINEPSMYVEVEPDPVLSNGCGHLIITDLWNRATPFIRYKTGDIARIIEGECRCGRALKRIAGIEGRLVDTVVLPGGRKVPGVSLTNRIIKDCTEVTELQVVQKTLVAFLLRYVKGPTFNSGSLEVLSLNLRQLLDYNVSVAFEEVVELPRSSSGKVRFVISEVSADTQVG
jgi:phenylacetate-CoA ligase